MEEKYITLLKKQIEKLGHSDFDLEAWKGSSIALISRIFGQHDSRIEQLQGLHIDYSSWALRDAKSTYNPMESCKRRGKELIEMTVDEIENFGLPTLPNDSGSTMVLEALESQLKVSQFKSLKKLFTAAKGDKPEPETIIKEISKWDHDQTTAILANVIENSKVYQHLE